MTDNPILIGDDLPDERDLYDAASAEGAIDVTADLSVGRGVIVEVARLAALEVPDVLRVARRGPPWRAALAGPPVMVRVRADGVSVRLRVIARPGADLGEAGRRAAARPARRVGRRPRRRRRHVVALTTPCDGSDNRRTKMTLRPWLSDGSNSRRRMARQQAVRSFVHGARMPSFVGRPIDRTAAETPATA